MESDLAQRMLRLWMSLLSIVASSSAFRLPASPPPNGSSIDSDWSTKNKKQPGFLRLISAWYAMVFLLCGTIGPLCDGIDTLCDHTQTKRPRQLNHRAHDLQIRAAPSHAVDEHVVHLDALDGQVR